MNRLSSLVLAAAIAFPSVSLGLASASAQDRQRPQGAGQGDCRGHGGGRRGGGPFSAEHIERKLQHLTIMLQLDANQQRMVRESFATARTEMEAARANPANAQVTREQRHAARRAILERAGERIDAVLNSQQRVIFDRIRAVMRARGDRHHDGPGGPGGQGRGPARAPAAPAR